MYNSKPTTNSLEISELAGKPHNDVLKAIRAMEPAWEKLCGRKFPLTLKNVEMLNGGFRETPCYNLDYKECMYIATKFNDEARVKLILRWEDLETGKLNVDLYLLELQYQLPWIAHCLS